MKSRVTAFTLAVASLPMVIALMAVAQERREDARSPTTETAAAQHRSDNLNGFNPRAAARLLPEGQWMHAVRSHGLARYESDSYLRSAYRFLRTAVAVHHATAGLRPNGVE
jgi:hypothetical protein